MNTKNLYLSLTVISSFFSALANGSQETVRTTTAAKDTFSGFYAMGSVGHSHMSAPRKGYVLDAGNPNVVVQNNGGFSSDRPIFSLGVGYATLVSPSILVGIEGQGFWDGHQKKSETSFAVGAAVLSLSEVLKKKYGFEGRVKIGYLVREGLCGYVGIGGENSSFSYTGNTNNGVAAGKASKGLWGFFPLVGMRVLITEKLSVDFSYKYTMYQGLSLRGSANGQSFYRSIHPSTSVAQMGVTYKIN